jgi:hypothetical protein
MNKFKLYAVLLVTAKLVIALPTIAIPNLVYSENVKKIGINNIDVRGAVIKTGKFKVVEANANFNLAAVNTSDPGKQASNMDESSGIQDGLSYILIGQVISTDEHINYYDLKGTDTTTGTRTLALTVSYKLLRLKDKASVAAFNAYGTGTETVFLKPGEHLYANQSMVIRDASMDLANNVVEQLLGQYGSSSKFDQKEKPEITEVKTYDN